jgi:hypothetical protein
MSFVHLALSSIVEYCRETSSCWHDRCEDQDEDDVGSEAAEEEEEH